MIRPPRILRAGDGVLLWNISANRDPAVFSDPDVFDVARTPNRHLTFGYGSPAPRSVPC